jgi:hypothetical protein
VKQVGGKGVKAWYIAGLYRIATRRISDARAITAPVAARKFTTKGKASRFDSCADYVALQCRYDIVFI